MFFVAFGNPAPIVSGTSELSWKCSAVEKKDDNSKVLFQQGA